MASIQRLVQAIDERLRELEEERRQLLAWRAFYTGEGAEGPAVPVGAPASAGAGLTPDGPVTIREAVLRYLESRAGRVVSLSELVGEIVRLGLAKESRQTRSLMSAYMSDFVKKGWCQRGDRPGLWIWVGRRHPEEPEAQGEAPSAATRQPEPTGEDPGQLPHAASIVSGGIVGQVLAPDSSRQIVS